ncbi:hypothetical protein GQ600_1305 [Phytophthora cactorum]|nr:hypothetical protein GQ600_1305 [Phytophthora cactorum]
MGKKSRRQRLNAGKPPPTKATDASASHAVDNAASQAGPRGDGMYSGTFRWLESKARAPCAGGRSFAEGGARVWRISNYWNEVAAFYAKAKVTLFFIGPEVDERDADESRKINPGTSRDCTADTSVIVGYNTGFGNFVDSHRHELLFSWLPDLHCIAESRIPAIFTCANDYADMNGEFAVQSRIVGANMLLLPKQNPFSAASHFHEEERRDTAWSRGSSFMYVVCGVDKARRFNVDCGDVGALQKRLDAELDIHLEDKLGRHFYKGMVLTKDQAARCKALTGNRHHQRPWSA